jgi:hypothetical protein
MGRERNLGGDVKKLASLRIGALIDLACRRRRSTSRCAPEIGNPQDAFFFGGLPIGNSPAGISQFGCLHFGQRTGREATRFTQPWPHRKHLHIMLFGICIFSHGSTLFY